MSSFGEFLINLKSVGPFVYSEEKNVMIEVRRISLCEEK